MPQNIDNQTQKGIWFMLLASFLFALTMLFAKLLSGSMGAVEVTFWRNGIGLLVILATLFQTPIRNVGGKSVTLMFRGIIGTVALITFFYTIGATSLSHAIVYAKTEPIFTAILAFFLLKEKLRWDALLAIGIGFAGVVVLSRMAFETIHIMGILTGFLSALAYTSVRSLKAYYDPRTVVLSFMVWGVVLPFVLMVGSNEFFGVGLMRTLSCFVMPMGWDWVWIILMGIAAAGGQMYMTRAYFYAKAGLVSTISYSVVLFATLFGILLGDVLPDGSVIVGAVLIVASGVMLSQSKG